MHDDTRFISTDEVLNLASQPDGWMALGEVGLYLAPDALHTLTSVVGLPPPAAGEPIMVVTGEFRTYRHREPVPRPLLIPARVWNKMPTIDLLVELLAPAGAALVREVEQMLQVDEH